MIALLPLIFLLSGCNAVVLNPSGDIALQQRDLVVISTALMLLIIIPVMALIVLFAWRYRHSNTSARYEPDWDHSTQLELVIWAAPLLIIICLGALTWMGTHLLDPFRPLSRVSAGQLASGEATPLEVSVVALDWKWLFIYPDEGIATVNELAAPVDRPINFRITASSVMNSFYIPALAGQIYAMPGMETKLHAVINRPGVYKGFSANYSGAGFSGMHFAFHGQSSAERLATKKANSALATIRPSGAPSWGIIAYQPRCRSGALRASSEASPSQVPPSARPWPMRNSASSTAEAEPTWSYPGRNATATVEVPSRNSAIVSLTPRPWARSIAMKMIEPNGRATNASAKMPNE